MNNRIKDKNIEEVTKQLRRAEVKKDKLVKDICKEYEVYLQIVRKCIFTSVEKGIYGLYSDVSINNVSINLEAIKDFLKKNKSLLIDSQLPLITIEQLKLGNKNDCAKQVIKVNLLKELVRSKEYKKSIYEYENYLIAEESLQFHSKNNSSTYEYYESLSEDELSSVNLDNSVDLDPYFNPQTIKDIDQEKQFEISLVDLLDENKANKSKNIEKINYQESDAFIANKNLNSFDLIDKSLTKLLLNLSCKINEELFKINLIKKLISEDTFKSLENNNYIVKYPHPFVIRYEFNKKSSQDNIRSQEINLFNITNVELEFYNLDLSISRNRINELKYKFQILHKKQCYWKQKEINLNNINK